MREHKVIIWLTIFILLLSLSSCTKQNDELSFTENSELSNEESETLAPLQLFSNEQYLRLDVEVEDGAKHTEILAAETRSNCKTEIHYVDVCDVRIEVGGTVYYLEDAIGEELISLEQIYGYSRIDARLGYCETFTKVRNGLTFLVFRYPEYELRFTYDYYILPDGEHRLVNELYISKNRYDVNSSANRVVHEDWGLTFEVSEVNSSSITLRCTQSGGQQLGELITDFFYIDSLTEQSSLPRLNDSADVDLCQPKIVIPRGAVSEITLNWADIYGELPLGDYLMILKVRDVYNPANNHPLMEKFETRQSYTIPFVI